MQAREYRPDGGRFLSQDRFESAAADQILQADPLTHNRYAFAGGNPVNNVEFDGHHRDSRDCTTQGCTDSVAAQNNAGNTARGKKPGPPAPAPFSGGGSTGNGGNGSAPSPATPPLGSFSQFDSPFGRGPITPLVRWAVAEADAAWRRTVIDRGDVPPGV
jgi:RHS repeat-associated protein